MKERLDILLVKRGFAPSREKAKAMIMEGNVFVENQREDKAGTSIPENAKSEIKGNTLKYVSIPEERLPAPKRQSVKYAVRSMANLSVTTML